MFSGVGWTVRECVSRSGLSKQEGNSWFQESVGK